jgi:DNA-binding MarR family transcriptional regulator
MVQGRNGVDRGRRAEDECEERIVRSIRMLIRAVSAFSRQLAAKSGVTVLELLCLRRIVEFGPVVTSDIAADVHMNAAKVVAVLDRLEHKGLVKKERKGGRRGSVLFTATDDGIALYEGIRYPIQLLFDARVMDRLAEIGCERIATSLEQIVRAIGADQQDGETPLTSIGPVDPGRET